MGLFTCRKTKFLNFNATCFRQSKWLITGISRKKVKCESCGLTLSNPIFRPPAYFPALIYFGRDKGWWITCNYPTVLKEKIHNVGPRPTLSFFCSRRFFSCSTDFSQQIAQVVLLLFLFLSFKTVG
jgi:hypothetical protein